MKCSSRVTVSGCVWTVLIAGWCMSAQIRAGSLDSPAAPTSTNSAMYTLEDIYNKVSNRAAVAKRTGVFTEPADGPTNATMRTLNEIMAMITNRPPVTRTGEAGTYAAYDDGNLKKGGTWPNPRFTDNGNETITDNLTGLMWTKNATNNSDAVSWGQAVTNGHNCSVGGFNDWRLPNRRELESLHYYNQATPAVPNTAGTSKCTEGDPFSGTAVMTTANKYYWSSSTRMGSTTYAWYVDMKEGIVNYADKSTAYFVWPVRGPL